MKTNILLQLLLLLILSGCVKEKVVYENQASGSSKSQYIVVLKEQNITGLQKHDDVYVNATMNSIETALDKKSLKTFTKTIKGGVFELNDIEIELLKSVEEVSYIEKDDYISINDVQLNAPYNLDRIDQDALPLDGSHTIVEGSHQVNAYVIDTGLRVSHEEFGDRSRNGFDFVSNDSNVDDCNGHGTHVAGTLAGSTYGVAKNVKVIGVRVLGCSGSGRFSDVISGIEWVTENHVKPAVANMSLGGGISTSIDQAVEASISSGVTYVVAAGNSSRNACNFSPARVEGAITVGSTTRSDTLSSFTNYGECVDIFAPGSDITSAWIGSDSRTNTISGTSMASPLVAGVAALYLSQNPLSTPQEVKQALLDNAILGQLSGLRGESPDLLVSLQSLIDVDEGEDDSGGDKGDGDEDDGHLVDNDLLEGLSGLTSEETFLTVKVEEGASRLAVTITGGRGDADLYLRYNDQPTRFVYDCRPFDLGNEETCQVVNPQAGIYHVMIRAFVDYKDIDLSVEIR